MTMPPVGKSGPLTTSHSSAIVVCGWSSTMRNAAQISRRLCGGNEVAIPTAMPSEPLHNKFGKRLGNTTGCMRVSS